MDVRLTTEQQQLRDAAAKLADDMGPGSTQDLSDQDRIGRLEKTVDSAGWRSLRSDEATGVEVAIVAEEFGRGLVDVPFLGPVLADDLSHRLGTEAPRATIAVGDEAVDARGFGKALLLNGIQILVGDLAEAAVDVDLTRASAALAGAPAVLGELNAADAERWRALALTTTSADLLGAARGAHALACDYAKVREQYGSSIGSYQAVAHMLADGLALIEGAISVLRHAAWAVDELSPAEAVHAAQIAKVYCADISRAVCETSIQVHGGIGNTWECLAHVYLRRVLISTDLWPVRLEDIDLGFS